MQELLGPDGGKRTLKSFAEEYLTEYNGHLLTNDHLWHIERINDNEVFFELGPIVSTFAHTTGQRGERESVRQMKRRLPVFQTLFVFSDNYDIMHVRSR